MNSFHGGGGSSATDGRNRRRRHGLGQPTPTTIGTTLVTTAVVAYGTYQIVNWAYHRYYNNTTTTNNSNSNDDDQKQDTTIVDNNNNNNTQQEVNETSNATTTNTTTITTTTTQSFVRNSYQHVSNTITNLLLSNYNNNDDKNNLQQHRRSGIETTTTTTTTCSETAGSCPMFHNDNPYSRHKKSNTTHKINQQQSPMIEVYDNSSTTTNFMKKQQQQQKEERKDITYSMKRIQQKKCRSKIRDMLRTILHTTMKSILLNQYTDMTPYTNELKQIRKKKQKQQQKQQQQQQSEGNSIITITTIDDSKIEKDIKDRERTLWNHIKIYTFTRTLVTNYMYSILYLLLTIQIHMMSYHLLTAVQVGTEENNDDDESVLESSSKNDGNSNNNSNKKQQNQKECLENEIIYLNEKVEDENETSDHHHPSTLQHDFEYLLQTTFEDRFIENMIPILFRIVHESVQQSFDDDNHMNDSLPSSTSSTCCWNDPTSPAALYITRDMFNQKINRIQLNMIRKIHEYSMESNNNNNYTYSTEKGSSSSSSFSSKRIRKELSSSLLLLIVHVSTPCPLDEVEKKNQQPNENINNHSTATTTTATTMHPPTLPVQQEQQQQQQKFSLDDNTTITTTKNYHDGSNVMELWNETLDLLESPIAHDCMNDCLHEIFISMNTILWGQQDDNKNDIKSQTGTNIVSQGTKSTTTTTQTLPLPSIISKLKQNTNTFYNTKQSRNVSDEIELDTQKQLDDELVTRIENLQSILDLGSVCFQ